MSSAIIRSLGVCIPEKVLTNEGLSNYVETSDEWIRTRTGIAQRRIAHENEATSDLALRAAKEALERGHLLPQDIDLLIIATMSPDQPCPATACIVQNKLGLRSIPCFDISAACSGFVYGLEIAGQMIRAGNYRHALLIGAEKLSTFLDWEDRTTCVLFGDAAAAVVMSASPQKDVGLLGSVLGCDGSHNKLLHIPAGGTCIPTSQASLNSREHYLKMNGREVFKHAVRHMEQAILDVLNRCQVTLDQVDWVVPHQANIRIVESLAQRMNLPMERFFINLERYGNTSAASIPLSLAQHQDQIQEGQLVLLVAFGAGLSWGANLIRWSKSSPLEG